MNPKRFEVIFDTDPGVDDAMALYFALAHPAIDVIGITTTFGNVTVEQAAINALYLTALAGVRIPVTQGIAAPLTIPAPLPPAHIHGADGLGNLLERVPIQAALDPRSSAQFIVDMARAHPGAITLVAVGPLGNLASALAIEPGLPQLLREVILMGGTVLEPGNVSAVAEANIANDPHAAALVFAADWKLTMVGLDVTHRVILPLALFKRIADKQQHPATTTLHQAVSFYADFYSGLYPHVARIHGCFGHDVLAFLYLVQPELFGLAQGRISVLTEGPLQGQTVLSSSYLAEAALANRRADCISQVCMQVDADACIRSLEDSLMRRWLG
jgi:inosine-uridine nucleoside N-ribohydrolase